MRGAFARTLAELARDDARIVLLTGDLGYLALEVFSDEFPERFFNVGVAEQNMVGLATGLAEAGYIPFVYSIVTFATLRCYEAIRNGPIQHQLPVRIVGVGGGMEYGQNGLSHYGLEDLAVMRAQPGISIVAPADARQTETALRATWALPGPIYYRLGKDDKIVVDGFNGRFRVGGIELVQPVGDAGDLLLLATGNITPTVCEAAQLLRARGVACTVAVVACLRPEPTAELDALLGQYSYVVTAESHYRNGGLGSLVCERIVEARHGCAAVRCGVSQMPDGHTGSQEYLHGVHGISSEALVQAALRLMEGLAS